MFNEEAATNAAQAPDPHAEVIPTPLSHTLILRDLSSKTDTNSIFANSGKIECFSNRGPIEFMFKFSSSSRLFQSVSILLGSFRLFSAQGKPFSLGNDYLPEVYGKKK